MFVVFFLLWIIFNGRVTTEIVLFGLAVSAALYWFICKFQKERLSDSIFILSDQGDYQGKF